MFDYLPRILFHILLVLRQPRITIQEPNCVHFRAWPFVDTDGVRFMAAPKYLTLMAVAAWVHGFRCNFLRTSLRRKWITVTKRTHMEFFKSVRMFQRFKVSTFVVTWTEFSALRKAEVYVGNVLTARLYMELVVLGPDHKKIPCKDWIREMGYENPKYNEWPPELEAWKLKRS